MSSIDLAVPNLGNFQDIAVVEVLVKPGDVVEGDTPLITLETEKASRDVPSPASGSVSEVLAKRGDKVSQGTITARLQAAARARRQPAETTPPPAAPRALREGDV